ncbi:glycoside hydrolase family 9 protein [uncultured Ruminococcus sp.]|uniref:glycoside hydrolase family 9 protein n=1 Tax=uncultured Ruminococcus sp. TaxID=165186 RepID=UPI00262B71BF|nr:glycoside hydrolase family 9 protein [uncultured Ruminococcus sp.]
MLKKKLGKKVAALASAAVMAVSATATGLTALSMTAFAGPELGEGTFNEGKGLPWHICESATAVMKFDITDGIYAVLIENPGGTGNGGEDRWDCQFRHRGLTIDDGHTYRLTYSVNPSQSGRIYSKLGDMAQDDKETWHGNGEKLSMTYEEGISQDELEAKLKTASKTGETVDYGQGWDKWKSETIPANQWTTVAFEFQAQGSSTGTGEWTFHMGGTGRYTDQECFPKGTIIRFDNLALIDMTDDKSDYDRNVKDYEPTGVEVNQVGYYPNAKKQATVVLADDPDHTKANKPASEPLSFEIKDAKGSTVYSGTTSGEVIYDEGGWNWNQVVDFTDFTTEGDGYKLFVNGKESKAFDINSNLFGAGHVYDESMLTYAVNYFYQNRSGVTTEDAYIPSGQTVDTSKKSLGRKDVHNPDTAYLVDEWVMQYTSLPSKGQSIDCTGGWYDAGDYGKYVVNGGISLWTLMNMYERSAMVGKADKWNGSELVNIPASDGVNESVSGAPNILNECKVELDFFLKMQRSDGMVYHKMHDYKWTGLAVAPYDDDGKEDGSKRPMRIVKPATYAATLNFAASCAQGARLFEPYDSGYASTLKSAAIKAYDAAKTNYKPFTDWTTNSNGNVSGDLYYAPLDQNKGGGPYGDTEVSDEFYWAACELYITTGDKTYYDELMKYGTGAYGVDNGKALDISTTLVGGENQGTCSLFTWGTLNSVGSISLYVNSASMQEKGLLSSAEVGTLKDQVVKAADYFLTVQAESAYSTPYRGMNYDAEIWKYNASSGTGSLESRELEGGYEWGSNSMVINNTMAMALAYDETKDVKYIDGVTTAFDYLLGRNPIEQSYVTGYGEHSTQYPHHRWWSGQLNDTDFPYAPYGVLSGGPNSNMNDPMVQGRGFKIGSLAPMKCYLDNVEAWSVNEVTINWNSPLCWVVSFIDDEAPYIQRDGAQTTKATTTTNGDETTTTASTDASGDASSTSNSNATTAGSVDPSKVLLGDTNLDGRVDITDAVLLNKKVAGAVTFNDQANKNADCFDQNGEITQDDAISLLKFLVHLVTSLPEQA